MHQPVFFIWTNLWRNYDFDNSALDGITRAMDVSEAVIQTDDIYSIFDP